MHVLSSITTPATGALLLPAALAFVWTGVWWNMRRGIRPPPGAGYTASDYAAAVNAILGSPYKAVDIGSLEAALGSQQPSVAVEAMVKANLLALRPYSSWASDVDVAAFGPTQDWVVVMAPSAVELYQMEIKQDVLLAALPSGMEVGQGVSCKKSLVVHVQQTC